MHLIKHHICDIVDLGTLVTCPALGIGLGEVNDGCAAAVCADGPGPYTRSLIKPFAAVLYRESIELAIKLSGHRGTPCAMIGARHIKSVYGRGIEIRVVEHYTGSLSLGRPECEMSALAVHDKLEVRAFVCRP